MTDIPNINEIYSELTTRYDRISASTIKSLLKGKLKVKSKKVNFVGSAENSPTLDEAEDAFKKYNCAIFTAFRGGYTLEENIERNALLKADLTTQGMKFRPVTGCYREADREYADIEYCFFVYNEDTRDALASEDFFRKAYALSARYDQDSFLYKRAGINRTAFLVATTDAGRRDLSGDIKFAGQLYIDVPDVGAWTDCSDGRFAFQLRGMVPIATVNKKIKLGEGNIFDVSGYQPDGIVVMRQASQQGLTDSCKSYAGAMPLVQHVFKKDNQKEAQLHDDIFRCLKKMRDMKCKKIGFHCTASINGSTVEGAAFAYETIKLWARRYDKKIDWIVIVDIYGDYAKVIKA